jgi:hypothetical protein
MTKPTPASPPSPMSPPYSSPSNECLKRLIKQPWTQAPCQVDAGCCTHIAAYGWTRTSAPGC